MEAEAMVVCEQSWAQRIRSAEQSGMSQKAWCRAHGVCPSTFYRWKRALKDKPLRAGEASAGSQPTFAELQLPDAPAEHPAQGEPAAVLHVRCIDIELPLDYSEEPLCRVLREVCHAR